MNSHSFTLILSGPDLMNDENIERFFEAGCDDATFGSRDGLFLGDFDREAPTFSQALTSGIDAVKRAVPGSKVIHVERNYE